jgi:lipoprotein-anchoring transpeptidase ErfK/SrfK
MTAKTIASLLVASWVLAGCLPTENAPASSAPPPAAKAEAKVEPTEAEVVRPAPDPALVAMYASRKDGEKTVPAIDVTAFHRELLRNEIDYPTAEAPGTVVIDPHGPFLYLVEADGKATRYGIAVGREGFGWSGSGTIARRAKWPTWTPPPPTICATCTAARRRRGCCGGSSATPSGRARSSRPSRRSTTCEAAGPALGLGRQRTTTRVPFGMRS